MVLVLTALGVVLVFEGLVFALLPSRLEEMIEMLERLPIDTRRVLGLAAVAAGVAVLWLTKHL